MCLRWQNGVLLVLPGLDLAQAAWRRDELVARAGRRGRCPGPGALVGAVPQMLAWNALYGMWLLPYPPHGTDFVRLGHPYVLETLFSSRHGLLSWTPLIWAGFLGLRPAGAPPARAGLAPRRPAGADDVREHVLGRLVGRRLVLEPAVRQLLPLLALGIAACLEVAAAALRRRPQVALAAAALPLVVGNAALLGAGASRPGPARARRVLPEGVRHARARLVAERVGSPPPGRPAGSSPGARAGRRASTTRSSAATSSIARTTCEGLIELGAPGDEALLGEGWGAVEERVGTEGAAHDRTRARVRPARRSGGRSTWS